jgi:pimeloyl-ACP methyl ester carboxylesterase
VNLRTPRVVLVHGTATSPVVWDRLTPLLHGYDVSAPERPRTGDLQAESAWLADRARGAWVVGMSGGATLGLELVRNGTPLAGAILHEPAVGSLYPDLLAPVTEAFTTGRTPRLARALYGDSWRPNMGETDDATTARELAMFRGFEPGPASPAAGTVVITYGAASPEPRHTAARALADQFGYATRALPDAAHFVAWNNPTAFADTIRDVIG